MRRASVFAFAVVTSLAGAARADILPDGHKSVKLSIRVDAEVPADKKLILAHTFRTIDVIQPGAVAAVEWHPLGGQMVIMSVPASAVTDKVEEQRKSQESEPLKKIEQAGTACHKGFDGVRTVPVSAPADEVRWNYKVTFSGDSCTATLASMEFFDKSGKAVPGTDVPNVPASAVPAAPSSNASASPASSTSAAPGDAKKGGGGCAIARGVPAGEGDLGGAPAGLLAGLGLFLAARRRRGGQGGQATRMR